MKKFVVSLSYSLDVVPPLHQQQIAQIHQQYLFRPITALSKTNKDDLQVQEELALIGRVIVQASEKGVEMLRGLGYKVQLQK